MKALLVDNILLERTATGFQLDLQPHLGLISLIATLREAGHQAQLYDPKVALAAGDLRLGADLYAAAAEQIVARAPDVVGFTSLGCNFIATLKIAAALRAARPNIPVLLGGPHASIVDREILERHPEFDIIVRGEAEATIAPLFAALGGTGAFDTIAGLSYRSGAAVVRTPDAGPVLDLDALPMPAYDAFPIAELQLRSLDIDAGRGCPFSCSFCSTASFFGRRYRIKSARRLVAEFDALAARYGIRDFNLTHDLFTVNKQTIREFCAAVAPRGYHWNCSARMDCVDQALLAQMRDAGCNAIYYGVETGSQRLQRVVDKRLDLELYHPTVRASLALELDTTVSFITGFPAETRDDRDATLELVRESIQTYPRGLKVQLHLLAPEPGTALYAQHRGSLRFDGHIGDFNFPLLESTDEAIVTAETDVFACHHYYADGGRRADDVAITSGFRTLYRLGHIFLAAITCRPRESFADMLREIARLREQTGDDGAALVEFVRGRWGDGHAYADIVRYLVAASELRDEAPALPVGHMARSSIRLTRRAGGLADCRDGAELLKRLIAGTDLETPPLERSAHLLIATPGKPAAPVMLAVDEQTLAFATALRTPVTRERLTAAFGEPEVERLLWVLGLLGAVVVDDGEQRPPPTLRTDLLVGTTTLFLPGVA